MLQNRSLTSFPQALLLSRKTIFLNSQHLTYLCTSISDVFIFYLCVDLSISAPLPYYILYYPGQGCFLLRSMFPLMHHGDTTLVSELMISQFLCKFRIWQVEDEKLLSVAQFILLPLERLWLLTSHRVALEGSRSLLQEWVSHFLWGRSRLLIDKVA